MLISIPNFIVANAEHFYFNRFSEVLTVDRVTPYVVDVMVVSQ